MISPIPPLAPGAYAIFPIQGTAVARVATGDPTQPSAFAVRCCCGYKAGPYGSAELAEDIRETHESACLWPRP